ncbi:MAG: NAD-dependent epimerase/dehydratase family protein [Thermoanaerobaculia bacterium]|nr:NAD-dependent epimerase/dehydratase family protein [Thermoanaerobaculia bacterium]
MGAPSRIVLTGASGFLGRYLLRSLGSSYRIVALDRHPRSASDVPEEADVEWHQIDIGDREHTSAVFRRIAAGGGAEILIHLAAHYDFTGEEHPEYRRTNVEGLRHVLEGARTLDLRRFVFASSVAACSFPGPGGVVDESSAPDGDNPYARSKRRGEEMLAEYRDAFPSCIVRFAALFSDWGEYPPLYFFLATWLSRRWNARILGGRGESAIPYLHVRDAALLLHLILELGDDELEDGEVLIASTDGAVSHRELFETATREHFDGGTRRPLRVPRPLCRPGMWIRDAVGRLLGDRPFERPWMADYVDKKLTVDASRTRSRIDWAPRSRLEVLPRIPFLIENRKTDPVEWERRNYHLLQIRQLHSNLQIYDLLQEHSDRITERLVELLSTEDARENMPHYQRLTEEEREWNHRLVLRNLLHAVRTRRKGLFMAYCRDLASRRSDLGFEASEVIYALHALHRACHEVLVESGNGGGLEEEIHEAVNNTIRFGIDQVEMVYEIREGWLGELPVPPIALGTEDGAEVNS